MKHAKLSLVIFFIIIIGTFRAASSQDKNKSEDINHILMKMQQSNSLMKYQGIMTTILINTPFSEVCRYKIENYGNILRKRSFLPMG